MLDKRSGKFATFLPRLEDEGLEDDYLRAEYDKVRAYARSVLLVLGILFFLFALADLWIIRDRRTSLVILGLRLGFLLMVLVLYLNFNRIDGYRKMSGWFTAFKILASLTFLAVFYLYESPNFLIQALGALSLMLGFYLVPNRWINMLGALLFLTWGFSFISLYKIPGLSFTNWLAVLFHLHLAVAFVGLASYQIHCHKRGNFLKKRQLARMSITDETTGLYNRSKLNEEFNYWQEQSAENDVALSMIFFDVDDLKLINDSYGHIAGDKTLKNVAGIISAKVGDRGIVARWGGDEFIALLPHCTNRECLRLADELDRAIRDGVRVDGRAVSCSTGVATYREGDDLDSFFYRADLDMYGKKETQQSR